MSETEKPFMSVFNTCNEACADMDFSQGGWMPEDGTYTCQIERTKGKQFTHDEVEKLRYAVTLKILDDGDFEGRSFSDAMFIRIGSDELDQGLRQLLFLATCLASREITNAGEAYGIIEDSIGEILNLEVFTRTSKGSVYRNIRYQHVVSTEAAAA